MVPIISIVGRSGAGKTTLLAQLIAELRRRGYRIGCIKHCSHDYTLDHPGKDSWRLRQAGSDWVALVSHAQVALMRHVETTPTPAAVAERFGDDVDLVLTEGYSHAGQPAIEIVRAACHPEPLRCPESLIAIATDVALRTVCPLLPLDHPTSVADFIEQRFLSGKRHNQQLRVVCDGKPLPIDAIDAAQWGAVLYALVQHYGVSASPESIEISLRS